MLQLARRLPNEWLVFAFTLLLVQAAACSAKAEQDGRPNILVILADDLGYGDLTSYGATDLRSPNIDRLASRGIRLDEFYANCPVCSPTRASLLSGRYPELVGVPGVIRTHAANSWGKLAKDSKLVSEVLANAGYRTAIIGKWHLGLDDGDHPTDRGFQFFHGFLGDMMDDYYRHRRHNVNYMRRNKETIDPKGHATDLFTQWTVDYLKEHAKRPDDKPFFLYLAYNAPHTPIQPPKEWLEKVKSREQISGPRAKLAALIEHMDDGIGQVIQTLDETKLADNTVVIFTSDNGGQLNVGARNGNLRDGKQSVYEGGLKVPFCAVWPGHIPAGKRSSAIGITMDLTPTICNIAGVKPPAPVDGIDITGVLLGKSNATPPRDLFFHRREGGERYGGLIINAVRRGDWKLLQNSPFAPLELYNLKDDPLESNDLSKSNRKKFRELAAALRVQVQRGGAVPWQPKSRRDD